MSQISAASAPPIITAATATVVSKTAEKRPGAISDVVNLFSHFGAVKGAGDYQEVHANTAARTAAARWPLLVEWLATEAPAPEQTG